MDSWDQETPSPDVKFEASPAESFLSMPGEMYPPLFGTSSPAGSVATMNPLEIMTPQSFSDDKRGASDAAGLAASAAEDAPSTPASSAEKRPAKKRKSWGQVLPEPKTNLPPRKRAKTEDEKEQRRVERVLRNRRAAQSSRERKRLEVEALEKRNQELESQLMNERKTNLLLCQELSKLRGTSGVVARSPVTLTPELFSSQDGHNRLVEQSKPSLDELMMTTTRAQTTINPTSLSPALGPVPDAAVEDPEAPVGDLAASEPAQSGEASPDLTQHPAVSVGGSLAGLEGLPAADVAGPGSLLSANPLADIHFDGAFDLQASIDADRYVLESQLLATPNSSASEYDCVAGDAPFAFPTTDFDFDDFLNDETSQPSSGGNLVSGLAAEPTLDNPETEASPEDPSLQPHAGASAYGCDNGGLAVGAF